MPSKKPVIGITLDFPQNEAYSKYPWYAVRKHYSDAVQQAGAIPIMLPYGSSAEKYMSIIDGLLLTGGDFDIDPSVYGEDNKFPDVVKSIPQRTDFEMSLLDHAFKQGNIPILGICGGMQLINVYFGGTLIQHIPDSGEYGEHTQAHPKGQPFHTIQVKQDSKLYAMANNMQYEVNSTHHQAACKVPASLQVSATALDGIIEAIEHVAHFFCIGVQWHPEYCNIPEDQALFEGFVKACTE